MRSFLSCLAGGALIIVLSFGMGLIHNSLRNNRLPLIPHVASTPARAGEDAPLSAGQEHPAEAPSSDDAPLVEAQEGEVQGAIGLEKARALFDAHKAVFIDARSEKAFYEGHIAGAMNVPYDKLVDYYDMITGSVPMDQLVVCYCWGPSCDFSDNLASELAMMGYTNVVVFRGGWEEWTEAGYPIEGTGSAKSE